MFENIQPSEEGKEEKLDLSSPPKTDNIFKELSANLDFGESPAQESKPEKTIEDYLKMASISLGIINITLLFVFIFLFVYVKIQNNGELLSKGFLNPICFVIGVDGVEDPEENCSSAQASISKYQELSASLSKEIADKMLVNVNAYYSIENFLYSKEIGFLLQTKNTKLKPLAILNDFDVMKNEFAPDKDKKAIRCSGVELQEGDILKLSCEAYAPQWYQAGNRQSMIVGPTGDRNTSVVEGTSLTLAKSFLNYIEKNPSSKFKIIEAPKSLQMVDITEIGFYSNKTPFEITLQYIQPNNNLSF